MINDVKKADLAREERLRQEAQEKAKPKTQESDFDKLVKKGSLPQAGQAARDFNKPVTERAMEEAAKRQEREQDTRQKEKEERKEKKESRETGERADPRVAEQKVVGKGPRGEGGRGGGEGRQGGYDGSAARRGLTKKLSKMGVRSLPTELQKRFAAKMADVAKDLSRPDATRMTQQVLNKIVQYVRIGLNRKGEKEIQLDLHEKIFRGLKIRVTEKDGKVNVHFQTFDKAGRAVFEKNAGAIREALAKKGVEVQDITVA
jgi:hypothetical protein